MCKWVLKAQHLAMVDHGIGDPEELDHVMRQNSIFKHLRTEMQHIIFEKQKLAQIKE